MNDIFETARSAISESLIRHYFDCSESRLYEGKNGAELMTLCPFRGDKKVGSFYINLNSGMWIDKSSSAIEQEGDFIKLVSLAYKLSLKEAAEKIIEDSGTSLPEAPKREKREKKENGNIITPIPEDKLKLLNKHIQSDFIIAKFGKAVKGWTYKNDKGPWMCVVRHITPDGKKNDVPYHFYEDGKFHAGCKVNKSRSLYNIEKYTGSKVLIVEGNKCADIEVEDFQSITWWGGGNQIDNYDWTPLKDNEDVIIWPDYDVKNFDDGAVMPDVMQPGLKAALKIQSKLKKAKILNVYQYCREHNKPDGWDIYDAKEDGLDLINFIEEVGVYEENKLKESGKGLENNSSIDDNSVYNSDDKNYKTVTPQPFIFMGHDNGHHYFLVDRSSIIKSISFGSFSNGKLLELAPYSFWGFNFPKKDGFDLQLASDWIIHESESKGFYKKEHVRGAGIWMDENRIIVNSGLNLYDEKGSRIQNFDTKYFYTHSQKTMGTFSGEVATNDQGAQLMNLFLAQGFETEYEAFVALGWSLIAPFAGILKWRPHIWITGPKMSGKSYFLENIVQPLIGEFIHIGSGKDSAPGIYRSVKSDPVPILLDEMEPGKNSNKDTIRRIEEKLELARNASSDFSGHITLANTNSGGSDSFFIRSPFCFASIVPYIPNAAIESRILTCRLKSMEFSKTKVAKTKEIMKTGIMLDPGIFRRKIFQNLRWTIKYIELLKKIITEESGDIRFADNLAPLFAASYSIVNDGKMPDEQKVLEFVKDMLSQIDKKDNETDEDKLLRCLFDRVLRVDAQKSLSIAELLQDNAKLTDRDSDYDMVLKRHGIKVHNQKDGAQYLAIATAHSQIQEMLQETMYSGQYVQVLKRHSAYRKNVSINFAGQNKDAVLLEWDAVETKYFKEPFDFNKIPF